MDVIYGSPHTVHLEYVSILAESRVESFHRTTAPPPSEEEPQSEPEPPDKKLLSPIAEVAPPIPPPRSPSPGIVITLDEIHRKGA